MDRTLSSSATRSGGAASAVIAQIVGRQITLDDNSYLVIGVMPNGFENVLAPSAELWAPLQYDISQGRAWGHHLRTVGRLRPGVSADRATQELNGIGRAVLNEQQPETYRDDVKFIAVSLQDDVTRGVRPALLAILGAVTLVLVIACVNVTNLLLARGVQRRGEFALRTALGAGRGRLIRQLLTESLLLAALGGVLGMVVAILGVRALVALSPPGLPRVDAIAVDGTVFAFALGITTLIGLAFGLIPALQAARNDPNQDLQLGSRRTAGGHRRTRSALVVAEVALALVLLVSSGLLLRSLERLFSVTAGFDSSGLLTMQVHTAGRRFGTDSTTYRFFAQALEAVRQVPGVTAAALTSQLPLSGDLDMYGVQFDPVPTDDPGELRGTFRYAVSPGYLEIMRIPLRRGRLLSERDDARAPLVALISESMAKRRLSGRDPIGQRLRIGSGPLYTVVGVVGDVKQMSLALNESDAVYTTATQWRFADNAMSLVVRARDNGAMLAPAIRQAVWSVDKDQPIVRLATMDDLRRRVGGRASLRSDRVRGLRARSTGTRRRRHLRRALRQRCRTHARDRRSLGVRRLTRKHPRPGRSSGDDAHWSRHRNRTGRSGRSESGHRRDAVRCVADGPRHVPRRDCPHGPGGDYCVRCARVACDADRSRQDAAGGVDRAPVLTRTRFG